MQWQTIDRPGYFGKRRDLMGRQYDNQYGRGHWRLVWQIGDRLGGFEEAVMVYEDAYTLYLSQLPTLLEQLVSYARDVYDDAKSNVDSGLDYSRQETFQTHIQDIAVRRAMVRLGQQFRGNKLIQLRRLADDHIGRELTPEMVRFHKPEWIVQPALVGWWTKEGIPRSVEEWYQSNRLLQVWK